ncbi:hypothetical protein [Confluentibacter flavum]|uniref:Glycoside hydrolase n=1 Tax=Confluentibacter flavum TaxID=1909700 RepID=A0A2N3HIV1_9FLAO|nr:hypothetical protein [Confluentibacter flavum]PKQ44899.1 hypothetical protein CSW08_10840 [Confluentibacter flavum]
MTKKIFILLFLAGCFTTFAQSKIDGDWKGTAESPNGVFELAYTFKVEGDKLTGALKTEFGDTPIENGKVDGKKFSYTLSFNGDMVINVTGELVSDDEISTKTDMGETKLNRVKS